MKINAVFVPMIMLSLFLVSCASSQATHYAKAGTTEQEFMKDRLACLQEVTPTISDAQMKASASPFGPSSQTIPRCGMLETCLVAHGYTIDPDGTLEVLPSMQIRCRK